MKTLLAIPSYNRPYKLKNEVLYWLESYKYDWKMFVEPSQYMYYAQSVPKDKLIKTRDNNFICGQMVDIGFYAKNQGYEFVFKVDDDMCFTKRKAKKPSHGGIASKYVLEAEDFFNKNLKCGLISVSKAMTYLYYKKKELFVKINKPIASNYFIRTDDLNKLIKREYLIFDDLIVSFGTKVLGKELYRYMGAYESGKTHSNVGGLQTFDRESLSKNSYWAIKKDYPLLKGVPAKDTKNNCFDVCSDRYFKDKFK